MQLKVSLHADVNILILSVLCTKVCRSSFSSGAVKEKSNFSKDDNVDDEEWNESERMHQITEKNELF
jgi:hypothetical protein